MTENKTYHKKTILQIVPFLDCGGLDRGTIDISKALIDNGFNSVVLSGGGKFQFKIPEMGAKFCQRFLDSKNPISILANKFFIEKIIKKENINLVHSRSRAPAWSAHFATKNLNIPHVTTFHGIYKHDNFIRKSYNKIMVESDKVIAVSNFVKDHIIETYGVKEDKISVIHRGIDLDLYKPENLPLELKEKFKEKYKIPSSVPLIMVPFKFSPRKGHEILIEALNIIKQKEFYCIMIGDLTSNPKHVQNLKELIKFHKLQGKVQIFCSEPKLTRLYNMADIVICPSIEPEAFGKTIVEAQAMKKLVISSNIGGANETIINEKTGFHFTNANFKDLSDKICYALSLIGSSKYSIITDQARSDVENKFSLEEMQNKTLGLYHKILS